jgi:hypothetical protein
MCLELALIGTENPTCLQSSVAIASEIAVMMDYLRSSSLNQLGLDNNDFVSCDFKLINEINFRLNSLRPYSSVGFHSK